MTFLESYIRTVDAFNRRVGRFAMYLIFALMGVLFWSSITKYAGSPALWTLEFAQFIMVAYYLLGGPYSMQMGDHVRMDLVYGTWSPRRKAAIDAVTVLFLIFYLCVLLYGGISSTTYAIEYSERAHSVWRPYMWPVKLIAAIGIFLMLLQALAELFRDILFLRGISVNHQSEAGI
ncbi:MAG: TRAP transporter small permease subunit [Hoeflea sp.]|uniref:TRAP transporter small permease subunit n=1 Tax=Hoeflea sp. TaxID=1940281 RepID=UPI002732143F|nr:TRAP transporter small permease subunit [Hoeflea sp.]MDP2121306.1 TRAP transporter small permease subunit [Hoeflea sp.]MDP3523303.1 TRAP transporter small permease subunit [Hoeflea sp.]MDZ7603279.1 TRAP transporter small permease subunit [Hoeflea sp.]